MRYYPRIVTKRGTVKIFHDEWHAERGGSLQGVGCDHGDLVFVCVEQFGMVPLLTHTNNPPHEYGNLICRLQRFEDETTRVDELQASLHNRDVVLEAYRMEIEQRMTPNEYQQLAGRTLIDGPDATYTPQQIMLVWNALGLAGEAGEVVDLIKKGVFHQHGIDRDKLIKELGDVAWYLAAICTKLDIRLEDVLIANVEKLKARYPYGWDNELSKAHVQ